VSKVIKRELGRDQDVDAAPTVDFSRLNDVLVLVPAPGDEPTSATAGAGLQNGPRGRL
jgi:hypothetical protein